MPKYRVVLTQTANTTLDVEASSPEEARRVAEHEVYAGVCHQCASKIDLDPGEWEPIDEDPELAQETGIFAR